MSQNDFVIASQTAPDSRADVNSALQALASQNSGATAPITTYANMIWYDTTNNQIKKRNEANSAWVTLFTIDDSNGNLTFAAQSVTNSLAVNTSNTSGQGIILSDDGDIVDLNDFYCSMRFTNGVRIYSANGGGTPVITLSSSGAITGTTITGTNLLGQSQTWQSVSRSASVWYQNTTERPIQIHYVALAAGETRLRIGPSTVSYANMRFDDGASGNFSLIDTIIPPSHYYMVTGASLGEAWELR